MRDRLVIKHLSISIDTIKSPTFYYIGRVGPFMLLFHFLGYVFFNISLMLRIKRRLTLSDLGVFFLFFFILSLIRRSRRALLMRWHP